MDNSVLHHFLEDLTPIAIVVTAILASAWVFSLIVGAFRHRANLRAQTDFHNRLMEKFSSADEFAAYLQSDVGRSFFDNLGSEPATPLSKIFASIQKGAILTLLGLGLFILGNFFSAQDGGGLMFVFGVVSFAVGAGFLVSSFVAYRLAKTWGLISAGDKRAASVSSPSSPLEV